MSRRTMLRALAAALALPSMGGAAWSQATPSAFTHAVRYDLMRREVGTISPDPDGASPFTYFATRKTYNAAGHLTKVEKGVLDSWPSEAVAPASWTGFTVFNQVDIAFDSMGRKVREATSGSSITTSVTEYGYDGAGRLKCTAVRMNPEVWAYALADKCVPGTPHATQGPDRITRNSYTVHGELLKVEQAVGTDFQQVNASYAYSPNGKRTSVTDANGNRAEMTYDGLDRQKRWIFPSKAMPGETDPADYEEYGYDANSNRTSLRKRDGVTLDYVFDAANRVSQKTVPASSTGAAGYSVFYGFDNRGLPTYARFGSTSGPGITNMHNGFGEIVAATTSMDGTSRTLTLQHDSNGNRSALVATVSTGGYHQTYLYDGLDRLKALQDYAGTTVAFSFDATGRRSTVQTGNPGSVTTTTSYGYDTVGRLISLGHDLGGTAADQTIGFPLYNSASQIVTRTGSNPAYAWSDPNSYVRSYAANGLNQYTGATSTGAGPVSYSYDLNGNLISDGATSFVYDSENRLVSASGGKTASLAYDPLGRLWQTSGGGGGTTRFLYDGDRLAIEYDGAGAILRSYIHGPGADEPLSWYEVVPGGWHRRFPKADHQGSIVAVAYGDGTPVGINTYDPWGIPGGTPIGRFGYTGQTWIPELGLWYYKARFYSPNLGRFMQVDPVGYEDQMNLYTYVGNDPINKVDPKGLEAYLVSRPTSYPLQDHMFVMVVDKLGDRPSAIFSYGPSGSPIETLSGNSELVSLSGTSTPTATQDLQAAAILNSPQRAAMADVSAVRIDAEDATVIAAGRAVDGLLGTLKNPGDVSYSPFPGITGGVNSNSAAYAVANSAVVSEGGRPGSQRTPPGAGVPGGAQSNRIEKLLPRTRCGKVVCLD